jgi:uncharacterized membrane protein
MAKTIEETIKDSAISAGGKEWAILSEAVFDNDFLSILSNQQKNLLGQLKNNPNNISGYYDYFADIIAKYISWKIYKESNLKILGEKVSLLSSQIKTSQSNLDDLSRLAQLTSGATALAAYSKTFSKSADRHRGLSDNLKIWYIISIICLLFVVGFVFFLNLSDYSFFKTHLAEDARYNFFLMVLILKIILVFFFFQIIQFFRKNYNAEKHLEEVYRHRSDVLQSLHAVYNSIDDKSEKDKLLSAAALFAYERGETGYITTKEGAGSNDITESLLSKIIK